jgi:TRAP transporter TAXI family solute receptor
VTPKFTIPANTYGGQVAPVQTFAVFDSIFARDDLSPDLVYQVTKAFWGNLGDLKKITGVKDMKPEYAYSAKQKVPYHPGALKYYQEIGLAK